MADVFAVQNEITSLTASTLASARRAVATTAGRQLAANKAPEDMAAYELVLRFRALEAGAWTKENFLSVKGLLERAIEIDPNYAGAHTEMARWALLVWVLEPDQSPQPPVTIKEAAMKAVGLDPGDPMANLAAPWGHFFDHQLDRFETLVRRAVELSPNDALVLAEVGVMAGFRKEWERSVALMTKSRALNRRSTGGWYHSVLFYDHYLKGEYDEVVAVVRRHPLQGLNGTNVKYVLGYAQLDRPDQIKSSWTS